MPDPESSDNEIPEPTGEQPVEGESESATDPITASDGDVQPDSPVVASLATEPELGGESLVTDFLAPPTKMLDTGYSETGYHNSADLDEKLQNLSAMGGAVGGLVLGSWSIVCALITFYGFINAGLAIFLGIYGLSSHRKGMAAIGIVLGVVGLLMSLMEINETVSNYFLENQDIENF